MKYNTISKIIARLEDLNIQVTEYKEDKKLCGYELNTYTNAGINQIIFIDFRDTEVSPKDAKAFIEFFNDRVEGIDIDDELKIHLEDSRYRNEIGAVIGATDFKDWKENLKTIFKGEVKYTKKQAKKIQFKQVVDKLNSAVSNIEEILELMPTKGNNESDCQKTYLQAKLQEFERCINGIELKDFTPNEYSGDFKLSYS